MVWTVFCSFPPFSLTCPPGRSGSRGQALAAKVAAQHGDIQQLVAENQRLATTHVALRQELAASQGEIQRLRAAVQAAQEEKEQAVRRLMDANGKLTAEVRTLGECC